MRKRRRSSRGPAGAALAPAVMWMRMPILFAEAFAPATSGKPETMRAVSEKTAAAVEGMVAANMSLASSMATAWLEVATGKHPVAVAERSFRNAQRAAERPFGKRVRANYKRLSQG